jgi:ABC-type polysaccharide/polyol phosphate export permease
MSTQSTLIKQSEPKRVISDCIQAFKAWHIWLYMGSQDVRNQFRRSRMGAGWLLINLGLTAGALGYIYGRLFHQDLSTFFPMLILGLVIWTFISSTIVQGCQAFVVSEGYIKQFSYSKQIYILRFLISSLINLAIGFTVFIAIAVYIQLPLSMATLWAIPGLLLLIFISIGHLIITAYWGSRYRDLSPALNGLFQILFYITPIIFTAEMLRQRGLDFVYQYNPLYYLIEIVRYPILYGNMADSSVYLCAIAYCAVVWTIALFTMFKYDSKVAYWL